MRPVKAKEQEEGMLAVCANELKRFLLSKPIPFVIVQNGNQIERRAKGKGPVALRVVSYV